MNLKDMTLADLLALMAKSEPAKKVTVNPSRKVRHATPDLTVDEQRTIKCMVADGYGCKVIARKLRRGTEKVRAFMKIVREPVVGRPVKPIPVAVEPADVSMDGLGGVKRSIERLHDKMTTLTKDISFVAQRLSDMNAALAKVQATTDRVVREFVNTNPPPDELVIHTSRNGHAKQ